MPALEHSHTLDKKTGEIVLTMMKAEPQKLVLLFAIPATAKDLTFRIS